MSENITLQERLTPGFRVDRDKRLVENVCLLSPSSKNGYEYSEVARNQAVPLYKNRPVYLDHAENPAKRSIRELAGRVVNPRMQEGKPYGDIKVARGSAGDTFLSLAEDQAEDSGWCDIGMSHVVKGRKSKNGKIVESIEQVLSVDLVAGPATTTNMRESEEVKVELLEQLKPVLTGTKTAVERLQEIYKLCGEEFKASENTLPVQLTIETVEELRKHAAGNTVLTGFLKEHDELQREKWAAEAIAEAKITVTDGVKNALKRCASKELMVEQAKVFKEVADAAKEPEKAKQPGRKPGTGLTVDQLVSVFKG